MKKNILLITQQNKGETKKKQKVEVQEVSSMTAIRKQAMEMLERVPEDKLGFVIQIMQGVKGWIGDAQSDLSLIHIWKCYFLFNSCA